MSREEQHRATSEAKRHVAARPVTAPSHEAGVARYLGAQHYRERQIHAQGEDTRPAADEPEQQDPHAPEAATRGSDIMSEKGASRPIVVGIDGSESALQAALGAADEAIRRGAGLRLVGVAHLPPSGYRASVPVPSELLDDIAEQTRQAVTAAWTAVEDRHVGLAAQIDVLRQAPVPALIDESRRAQLLVLGSRGRGGFTGILVGSTAVALVAHGHCPVAVIRGDVDATGPVVVGADGSPTSEAAVELAFDEAALRGAPLVAVHTWTQYTSDLSYAAASQFAIDWDSVEQRETRMLTEQLATWQAKYPDVPVRQVLVRDRPARRLLEESAHAQLLVVGSRGHGGFTGMVLGSTSQALVYHATVPLLVVRHD